VERARALELRRPKRGGFLVRGATDSYVPSRPPVTISAEDVLRKALEHCAGEEAIGRSRIAAALRESQLERAGAFHVGAGDHAPAR